MITAIGDVMRQCYDRGWITTRDGNASLRRRGSNYVYITPSGVRKNKIEVESIIKMKIDKDGNLIMPEGGKPSGELHMHWNLLKDADKTRAVLHVHPTHVIAAIYAGYNLNNLAAEFPEIHRYTRVAPNVPNVPAVSVELGNLTYRHLTGGENQLKYDIVGQANHGVCSVAGDPWSAYEHVERLDHICEIVLKSGVRP
jgi:ribulose-5-phosphate 4-epimerase/fuculose-1-phosphate aldolase